MVVYGAIAQVSIGGLFLGGTCRHPRRVFPDSGGQIDTYHPEYRASGTHGNFELARMAPR